MHRSRTYPLPRSRLPLPFLTMLFALGLVAVIGARVARAGHARDDWRRLAATARLDIDDLLLNVSELER